MWSSLVALSLVAAPGTLGQGFANPPDWARPHTWWHWMAGNVTKSGITADLEAMKAAGIGGAHIFDVGQGIPDGPVAYNSKEWRALMAHALKEGQRLGLDMTIHNCSGWSSSGAPWVRPEDAMKRLVSTTARVEGGSTKVPWPRFDRFYYDIAAWLVPADAGGPAKDISRIVGYGPNPGDVDLSSWPVISPPLGIRVNPDGTVPGGVPAGDWTLVRLGYELTNSHNVASRPTGDGLEVDKLSADALDRFLEGGMVPLFKAVGGPVGHGFSTVLVDSYETGFQNWTPGLIDQFRRLRGYNPSPYLPALAGFVVGDAAKTKEFLFDYRRTLSDLWAENYSGHFAKRLKEFGLQLAIEPYGNGNIDPFTYGKPAGLIMGEYWVGEGTINGAVKNSASVAHVYGKPVVGAEGLTAGPAQAGWRNQPRQWKPFADRGYTTGVNRIIYHRFAHQPFGKDVLPGMTMGPWGSHVDRTNTIWPYMRQWDAYLARCQYLLQSGRFVGDVLVFTGEQSPQQYVGEGTQMATVPAGYDFDHIGFDPLKLATAKNGRIVLPNGASYALLALPQTDQMTVALARRIRALVEAGAVVVGPQPTGSPSLADGPQGDAEVARIGRLVWGAGPAAKYGKGRVFRNSQVGTALKTLGIPRDFTTTARRTSFIHRKIAETDAYFVAMHDRQGRTIRATFRVSGKVPELWDPVTGAIRDAAVWQPVAGGTAVDLPLEGDGSVFVVFRRSAKGLNPVVELTSRIKPVAAKPLPKLAILRAEYGALDQPGKFVDVTDRVASLVDGGGIDIMASNDDLGGDPAYNIVKAFRVTYKLGDEVATVRLTENERFAVGQLSATPEPPAAELVGGKLAFWRNGSVALRWADGKQAVRTVSGIPAPKTVSGGWNVRFPAGWDAPTWVHFPKLASWTDNADFGIKHFSGTATYSRTIDVPADWLGKGRRVSLDLGDVRELARLRINGRPVAQFWSPPFRADVTSFVRAGQNRVEVDVTNLWTNRLIGDEQFPDDMGWNGEQLKAWPEWFVKGQPRPEPRRKTFTTWRHNTKDTPLLPSGLIGPVVLRPIQEIPAR